MRQSRYLNVILTVNALLLTGLLWTQWSSGSGLAQSASAQTQQNLGVSSAEQRVRMVENLDRLQQSMTSMQQLLESGKIKVQVTNLKDALATADTDKSDARIIKK